MTGCYYTSLSGIVFGWTQVIPTAVTSILSIFGLVTGEIIAPFCGLYLHASSMLLWIFQTYMQRVRPNPVCQLYQSLAFPSIVAYYVASVLTFIIVYAYLWNRYLSWFKWLILYALAALPLILISVGYNYPGEVGISMLVGVIVTAIFVIVLKVYISPALPYLLNAFPFTVLKYKDTYLMCEKERVLYNKCRLLLNTNAAPL